MGIYWHSEGLKAFGKVLHGSEGDFQAFVLFQSINQSINQSCMRAFSPPSAPTKFTGLFALHRPQHPFP